MFNYFTMKNARTSWFASCQSGELHLGSSRAARTRLLHCTEPTSSYAFVPTGELTLTQMTLTEARMTLSVRVLMVYIFSLVQGFHADENASQRASGEP